MDTLEIIGVVLGVLGIISTSAIAYWQHKLAGKAQRDLQNVLNNLPAHLLQNVSRYLQEPQSNIQELYDLEESDKRFHTSRADLDGDGEDELLVQRPYGAHNAVLQVYGFRGGDFKLIDEIEADTMGGFVTEDKDADGRLEVVTLEVSPKADFPYAMGFRDEVWYRLKNDHFVEVKRINRYKPDDLKKARRDPIKWITERQ